MLDGILLRMKGIWNYDFKRKCSTEATTKTIFKISVLFFQEHLFWIFHDSLYVAKHILISKEGIFVRRKDTNFPAAPFFVTEQILIDSMLFTWFKVRERQYLQYEKLIDLLLANQMDYIFRANDNYKLMAKLLHTKFHYNI